MENSKIEWTHHTFNPWIGCTRVSPGCVNCYAETMMDKRYGKVKWGPTGERKRTSADYWKQPLKWNREAAAAGERRRVFCASLADVFEDKPDQNHKLNLWRDELWWLIEKTTNLDWLLLTKRPEVIPAAVPTRWKEPGFPPNVWIGTSVENQEYADKRIPELLKIPAAVRFLSVEPLLGPVDLEWIIEPDTGFDTDDWKAGHVWKPLLGHEGEGGGTYYSQVPPRKINWVIVGGESGPNARPMHPDWVRSIRDQCQAAGVPFLFKQWGEWAVTTHEWTLPNEGLTGPWSSSFSKQYYLIGDGVSMRHMKMEKVGKHRAGRELDGREWDEFPQTPTGETM